MSIIRINHTPLILRKLKPSLTSQRGKARIYDNVQQVISIFRCFACYHQLSIRKQAGVPAISQPLLLVDGLLKAVLFQDSTGPLPGVPQLGPNRG